MAIKKIDSFNKHQNPSTNQNPFDIENYLNVNWNKAQEVINNNADELKTAQNNISEIKQEQITQNTDIENIKKSNEEKAKEIASLKTELENEKSKFENYAIHGKSTGEYIHLTDSSETDCRVDVRGNSKQATREGKNVYNAGKTINDYFVMSGAKGNTITQYTAKNYVTCKIDKGVMTVEKYNTSGYNWISKWIEIDRNTDYTISLDKSITNVSVVGFSTKENKTEGVIIAELISSKKDVSFNSGDYAYYAVSFYPKQGLEIAIQIEKGKQKTTFEQYGAMPSLDYPSKIETVGSNKNIFNILKYDYRFYSCGSAEVRDNSNFRIIATKSTDQNCSVMFKILDLTKYAGKTLTIQAFAKSSTNTNKAFIVLRQNNFDYTGTKTNELYDETQNTTNGVIKLKYKVTDTINDNNKYLFIGFYATRGNVCAVGDYVDYEVKIEEGSVATSYSKFGQGSIKVTSCNKNYIKLNDIEKTTVNGITYYCKEGKLHLDGTTTDSVEINFESIAICKGNYCFNCNSSKEIKGSYANYLVSTKPYEFLKEGNGTFSINENRQVYYRFYANNNVTFNNVTITAQLEKGTTATEYQVHKEDSVVLPIQEEMLEGDYLDKVNKKEVHTWKKIILDGVNNKVTQETTSTNGKYRYKYTDKDLKNCSLSEEKAYCTHLPLIEKSKTYDKILGFTVANNSIYIYTDGDTLSNFNAKLQEENYIFYIPVIESAYEKIDLTPEQIQALEKLDKLKTYKNITNITTDSIAILDVDYKKDLETVLSQITKESEA